MKTMYMCLKCDHTGTVVHDAMASVMDVLLLVKDDHSGQATCVFDAAQINLHPGIPSAHDPHTRLEKSFGYKIETAFPGYLLYSCGIGIRCANYPLLDRESNPSSVHERNRKMAVGSAIKIVLDHLYERNIITGEERARIRRGDKAVPKVV